MVRHRLAEKTTRDINPDNLRREQSPGRELEDYFFLHLLR